MKTVLSIVLTIAFVLHGASIANACSCIRRLQPNYEKWLSDEHYVLFSGKVVGLEQIVLRYPNDVIRNAGWKVTFKIKKSWENVEGEQITIMTGNSDGDCGYEFKMDEEYFVDAWKGGNEVTASICSWTQKVGSAKDIIQTLEKRIAEKKDSN